MDKQLRIEQIERTIKCIRNQLNIIDDVTAPIILETVSMLEMELEQLKEMI